MVQKIPYFLLIFILAISFCLMLLVSTQESAIMDELAHIPAGYGYLHYFDYCLNPEHPPLVKILAAVPLVFMNLKFPIASDDWLSKINGQWGVGNQFIYHSGNDADKIIFWARVEPILLTLLLIVLIYIWAKELLGSWWALLPAFLFGFSPTVLAHGHYVTTDIGAALGVFLATYFFIKFLLKSTKRNLIFAGLTFGVAQLMKFSAVLLIPFFIFLTLVWCWRRKIWRRYLFSLIIIFLIGYFLVYLIYFIFTLNYPVSKQVADTKFILNSFGQHWLTNLDIVMAGNRFLRPLAHYFLGVLMVSQRSTGGNTNYFLGQISNNGWWYYFPVVFFLKEPIPSLILILMALIFGITGFSKIRNWKIKNIKDYLGTHFAEFAMLIFVVFYWAYSMHSKLNIGVRHILPTLPFIYILATAGLKNLVNKKKIILILVLILLGWYFLEMVWAYPFYLSYFNQFGGGVFGGYKYVTDSNYDWGQDLKRLKDFVEEKNISKISVDYFGGGDTGYYLKNKAVNWSSDKGNPKDKGIDWLAISVNTIQSFNNYPWLRAQRDIFQPDFKAGTSIFIYKL